MNGPEILSVTGIAKRFETVTAVDDVSFSVSRGEILGFLGPNGAGKTTTLRMILGIFDPDAGDIRFSIGDSTAKVPKERTGYLPEERGLYGDAKVLDLLVYFGTLKGLDRAEARQRAHRWLERFDLTDWESKKVEKLSKGMQQKVQFTAAVLHRPDFVVLDEPFSGLDPVNQDLLKEVIRGLKEDGAAVLLSSHQMNRVEEVCDRIFLIHNGRRVLYGDLDEIKEGHGEHAVQLRFVGPNTFLVDHPGVVGLTLREGSASFHLAREFHPDDFVRGLPEEIEIRAIHVDRPPLHDIFVQTIEGGGA
ncbi:ATP-binding cassette domain-containing protein [Candidatus Bipolaricaulota bacterium]|nr:ATP-binding cassette domain-containing protein [Candidatus Bipolaricaulota bacterium]